MHTSFIGGFFYSKDLKMFWKAKARVEGDDYQAVHNRITALNAQIATLSAQLSALDVKIEAYRLEVKDFKKKAKLILEKEIQIEPEGKNINTSDYVSL